MGSSKICISFLPLPLSFQVSCHAGGSILESKSLMVELAVDELVAMMVGQDQEEQDTPSDLLAGMNEFDHAVEVAYLAEEQGSSSTLHRTSMSRQATRQAVLEDMTTKGALSPGVVTLLRKRDQKRDLEQVRNSGSKLKPS